jgi:DNA-directed RNA polymerase subunit D
MKIDVLEDSKASMSFTIKDCTNGYANALRRISMNSIPTFAIDRVTFYENSSAIFDEYIAHRIGLVPITTPQKGYGEKDEILFTLEATGPKTVYSSELVTSDNDVKVANDKIPIIKLGDDQRLRIEAKAVMGTALKHAKFQPGLATFDQKDASTFQFYIESFGQMPPRQILNKAFDVIEEEISDIEKKVKKL